MYDKLPVVPPGVVTLTLTAPGVLAGIVAVICVSLLTVKHAVPGHGVTSDVPTCTSVAPVKKVPVRTTLLPPSVVPDDELRFVRDGSRYVYVWFAVVPPGVVTLTLNGPAELAGMVTVICVSVLKVKHAVAGHALRSDEPTCTSVAPVKKVPVRITLLPPTVGPEVGLMLVNVGNEKYVYV